MKRVESSREPERLMMVWPGCPAGLSKDQARNWFLQHKKPKGYQLERFDYDQETGLMKTIGYETCR